MNVTNHQNEKPASANQLQAKLDAMEKAGASIAERMQAAVAFFETVEEQNPRVENDSSEPNAADEELLFETDPKISDQDPNTSDQHASRSEQEASTSEQTSDQHASRSEPPSEPQLPAPPKFQFGLGNPLYEVALDFRAHRDKRSILDHLSDTQRHAIIQLLEDHSKFDVVDLLAKHPPAGLGIHVSRPALNRFRKRYQKQERRRNSLAFQIECDRLMEAAGRNDQAFLYASERMLKMRLFEITGDPNANLQTIDKLTDVITRLRKQTLAERKHSKSATDAANDKKDETPTP